MSIRWLDLADMRWETAEDADDGKFRSEARFRDYLAMRAIATGWQVTTEYHLGAWGRIDLLAVADSDVYAVECKLELRTAGQVRAAVQQVASYTAQLTGFGDRLVQPVIVAPNVSRSLCDAMLERTGVVACTAEELIDRFDADGSITWAQLRLAEMAHRAAALRAWASRQACHQNIARLHEALAVFSVRGLLPGIAGVTLSVGDVSCRLDAAEAIDLRSYAVASRRLSAGTDREGVVADMAEELADAIDAAGARTVGELACQLQAQS